jgi:hypothetical protein
MLGLTATPAAAASKGGAESKGAAAHSTGRSPSDPDGTLNGGVDKPGGEGGIDPSSRDGNNGSGNDADCEDDNRGVGTPGSCAAHARNAVRKAAKSKPVKVRKSKTRSTSSTVGSSAPAPATAPVPPAAAPAPVRVSTGASGAVILSKSGGTAGAVTVGRLTAAQMRSLERAASGREMTQVSNAAGQVATAESGRLARTGGGLAVPIALAGAAALAAGGGMAFAARRREE